METKSRSHGTYPLQFPPLPSPHLVNPVPSWSATNRSSVAYSDRTTGEIPSRSPSYPLQASPRQSLQHANGYFSLNAEIGGPVKARHEQAAQEPQKPSSPYPLQLPPSYRTPQRNSWIAAPAGTGETNLAYGDRWTHESQKLPDYYASPGPRSQSPLPGVASLPAASNGASRTSTTASEPVVRPSKRPVSYPFQAPLPLQLPQIVPTAPAQRSETTAFSSGRATKEVSKPRHSYPSQAPPPGYSSGVRPLSTVSRTSQSMTAFAANESPHQAPLPGFIQGDGSLSPTSEASVASSTSKSGNGVPRLPRNIRAVQDGKNTEVLGRTIVICLDGRGDKFDSDNSNIVHLVSCLKKSDPSQVTYYQSGIGTYDGGGLSNGANAALDMAIGSGLGVHIRDAYHFLMQTYKENDRICLFGFSRGAYTARCLAGMIHKVGLLPAHNIQQIPFAYQYYKDDTEQGWDMSGDFKRTFCMDVSVHFIGVFDSVASVGFIPRTLPLSSTPWNKATYFRHAMALDERRAKFKVKQFETKDSTSSDSQWETVAEVHENTIKGQPSRRFDPYLGIDKPKPDISEKAADGKPIGGNLYLMNKRRQEHQKKTDVLEVWFTGAHADIGGGAVKNEERHKLAQIPLRWMLRQCFECNTGIIFKVHRLAEEGLDVHTLWPTYTSLGVPLMGPSPSMMEKHEEGKIAPITRRSSVLKAVDEDDPQGLHDVVLWKDERRGKMHEDWVPEHVEDYFDCISRINDQLVDAKGWWILEILPLKVRVQLKDSEEWVKKLSMNLGRYRAASESHPNLHWTVQQRVEAMGYQMHIHLDRHASWNVVA
ncbi:hypothetical protein LTR56_020770 [Elasticomyces elasticus]|nr:hypothetical protein LTR56_020770 [Elasticomyces elasticus]